MFFSVLFSNFIQNFLNLLIFIYNFLKFSSYFLYTCFKFYYFKLLLCSLHFYQKYPSNIIHTSIFQILFPDLNTYIQFRIFFKINVNFIFIAHKYTSTCLIKKIFNIFKIFKFYSGLNIYFIFIFKKLKKKKKKKAGSSELFKRPHIGTFGTTFFLSGT